MPFDNEFTQEMLDELNKLEHKKSSFDAVYDNGKVSASSPVGLTTEEEKRYEELVALAQSHGFSIEERLIISPEVLTAEEAAVLQRSVN